MKQTRSVPLTPRLQEALERQREAFIKKFGREPSGDDPIFFDPNKDTPTPLSEAHIARGQIEDMRKVGIRDELIYATAKTGMIISDQNKHMFSADDLEEFTDAVAEFRDDPESCNQKLDFWSRNSLFSQ